MVLKESSFRLVRGFMQYNNLLDVQGQRKALHNLMQVCQQVTTLLCYPQQLHLKLLTTLQTARNLVLPLKASSSTMFLAVIL